MSDTVTRKDPELWSLAVRRAPCGFCVLHLHVRPALGGPLAFVPQSFPQGVAVRIA